MLTKEKLLAQYQIHTLRGPLNGVIVLGLCYYVAGPMALQNLVTQGALVIKVEGYPIGDPSRHVFSKNVFNSLSYGQLSIGIDYQKESDKRLLTQLFQLADVIVDNRSIKAKRKDSLLLQHLHDSQKSHSQIYCSINGFPDAAINNEPALDASVQAATGLAYTNCYSPDKPLKIGIPVLDQVTGLLAAQYITSNLYFLLTHPLLPETAKKLIYISVSMAGVAMWLQTGQVMDALEGEEFLRSGNQDKFAAPFSFYKTKNGLISIATVNEVQFKRLCLLILKDESFHAKYPTVQIRLKNQEQFEHDLNEKLQMETREYWHCQCKKFEIPASPVLTVSEALQQNFVQKLLTTSKDGTTIITHGTEHSFFKEVKSPTPAPQLDRDRNILHTLNSDEDSGRVMMSSKL